MGLPFDWHQRPARITRLSSGPRSSGVQSRGQAVAAMLRPSMHLLRRHGRMQVGPPCGRPCGQVQTCTPLTWVEAAQGAPWSRTGMLTGVWHFWLAYALHGVQAPAVVQMSMRGCLTPRLGCMCRRGRAAKRKRGMCA